MSTHTTTLDLNSFDRTPESTVLDSNATSATHWPVALRARRLTRVIGTVAIAPLVVLALTVLVFMFLLRLLIAVAATIFDS